MTNDQRLAIGEILDHDLLFNAMLQLCKQKTIGSELQIIAASEIDASTKLANIYIILRYYFAINNFKVANFNRRFFDHKQVTPSDYRKQARTRYTLPPAV